MPPKSHFLSPFPQAILFSTEEHKIQFSTFLLSSFQTHHLLSTLPKERTGVCVQSDSYALFLPIVSDHLPLMSRPPPLFGVLLLSLLLHSALTPQRNAAALRLFPREYLAKLEASNKRIVDVSNSSRIVSNSTQAVGELEDSKRRIPSCPDPLHNR